jgi:3-hydroxyisobutyrate dehydrogenase
VVIDTSTVSPGFARTLAGRLADAGHRSLEARLLGNAQHAVTGELRVMAGGDKETFERVQPLLAALGKEVTYLGGNGTAATLKLVLNMLMGVEMQALAEAIVLGEEAGLERQAVIQAIAASGFSSPVMRFKCGVMGRRAFTPADFRLALMHKDLALVRTEAQRLGVLMPGAEAAYSVLTSAVHSGMGALDCAAVVQFMEDSLRNPEPARDGTASDGSGPDATAPDGTGSRDVQHDAGPAVARPPRR